MKVTRWASVVALGLLAALTLVAAVGVLRFRGKAQQANRVPQPSFVVEATPQALERGRHLASTLGGCTECHGSNLAGRVMEDNALVRLTAPNITPAGVVGSYRDGDWYRAILHGVSPSGRNLLVMPSKELRTFSDADVAAMVAYVRSVPPVNARVPESHVSIWGQALLGLAGEQMWSANKIAHDEPRAGRITPAGANVAHGEYLIGVCKGCHGPDLRGGLKQGPDAPPSADISPPAMAGWSRDQFEGLLRRGKRRNGADVNPAMPWRAMSAVTDEELTAMWLALRE